MAPLERLVVHEVPWSTLCGVGTSLVRGIGWHNVKFTSSDYAAKNCAPPNRARTHPNSAGQDPSRH